MEINNETARYGHLREKAIKCLLASGYTDSNGLDCFPYELILEIGVRDVADRGIFKALMFPEPDYPTEIRLHLQDVFLFDQWGLYLLDASDRNDMTFTEHTFPDPTYFTRGEEELSIFYNGNLSLSVNNFLVRTDVRTDRFRMFETERQRRRWGLSGLVDTEEVIVLMGWKNNYFMLDLPRKRESVWSTTRLRLRLKGILFRNITICR
jgi:hypothetical protein